MSMNGPIKRGHTAFLIAMAFILLASVAVFENRDRICYRFREVAERKVYRSAEMPSAKLTEVAKRHGIKTVVDFRTFVESGDNISTEQAVLTEMGITHVHLPSSQAPDDRTVEKFLAIMDEPSRFPVLIHCRQGIGRAILFAGIYRIEYEGWTGEQALKTSRCILRGSQFDYDAEKGRFLMNYTRRRTPK